MIGPGRDEGLYQTEPGRYGPNVGGSGDSFCVGTRRLYENDRYRDGTQNVSSSRTPVEGEIIRVNPSVVRHFVSWFTVSVIMGIFEEVPDLSKRKVITFMFEDKTVIVHLPLLIPSPVPKPYSTRTWNLSYKEFPSFMNKPGLVINFLVVGPPLYSYINQEWCDKVFT